MVEKYSEGIPRHYRVAKHALLSDLDPHTYTMAKIEKPAKDSFGENNRYLHIVDSPACQSGGQGGNISIGLVVLSGHGNKTRPRRNLIEDRGCLGSVKETRLLCCVHLRLSI